MDSKKFRDKHGPEHKMQIKVIEFLVDRGWRAERMIGNALQTGIPDIYIMHLDYGNRWVDLKVAGKYEFTKAQRYKWPLWEAKGTGIWIITDDTEEEYAKLFKAPNMRAYWKPKYDENPIEGMLEELYEDYNLSGS